MGMQTAKHAYCAQVAGVVSSRVCPLLLACSPTGALLSHGDWLELIEVIKSAGCHLFSDEMYRLLGEWCTDSGPVHDSDGEWK